MCGHVERTLSRSIGRYRAAAWAANSQGGDAESSQIYTKRSKMFADLNQSKESLRMSIDQRESIEAGQQGIVPLDVSGSQPLLGSLNKKQVRLSTADPTSKNTRGAPQPATIEKKAGDHTNRNGHMQNKTSEGSLKGLPEESPSPSRMMHSSMTSRKLKA